MVTQGLVSVIIPTYNRGKLVLRAVESALSQTHPKIEALIVDDGSRDDTREQVARAYPNDPRVRYIFKQNGGVSSARNLGLREAHGEFVAFLDSDDLWLPGKVALQLECLRRFPEAGMVWTDMAAVDEAGQILHDRFLRRMYSAYKYYPSSRELFAKGYREDRIGEVPAYFGDIFSPMVLGNLVHTSTVLLRRARAAKVGSFDESKRTGEDYPFHLKTCAEGPVAFVDTVTVHYTIGAADALSSPEKMVKISENFLSTLQSSLRTYGDRIELPRALLGERLADAHAWVGEELLRAGQSAEARVHFLKAIRTNPKKIALLRRLAESLLPAGVRSGLRSILGKAPPQ
jgi:glycosyltransferase involved in cell wall biosynthesis